MKSIKLLIMLCAALLAHQVNAQVITSGDYQITLAPANEWVTPQALAPQRINREKSPVHYRLIGRQERFTELDNEYYQDFAATALNQEGVKELSKIELTFNPEFEKLTLHKVEVERKSAWHDRLDSARINVINQEQELSNDLFNGLATAVIVLKDVRVGDTIRYQYTVEGRNPVYGKEFGSNYPMGWEVSVDKLHLKLVNASNKPLNIQDNQKRQPKVSSSPFGKTYEWQLTDVPKYRYEEGVPAGYLWAPVIFVSSTTNWTDVSAWAKPHYQFKESHSKALTAYIKEVKQSHQHKADQIAEFIRFVQQDVRYFGIEIGQNSHIPHSPNTVFERRYGDCKDKASLLIALLNSIDVPSSPALVNSQFGATLNERTPSPILFDHVINQLTFEGRHYFIDATNNHQAIGLASISQPDFGYALVLSDNINELTPMPQATANVDKVSIEQHYISSNYMAPVDLYITTKYHGREADYMRYQLSSVSLSEIEQHYLNYYAKFYRDISLAAPVLLVDTTAGENELLMTEHYQIGDFWQGNNQSLDFSLFASYIKNYVELPKVINRTQPLALPSQVAIEQTLKVTLPENINYQVRDIDTHIKAKGIGYNAAEAYINGQFVRRHQLVINQKTVTTEESRDYINALREIDDNLYYSGGITGDFSKVINHGIDFLNKKVSAEGAR
ncbi:DUF3857 domain-containing protein [Shewanella colwelliana]|uniref:DUF3857 domain-containing transglutaminase family protein n=1 Tax=Shewanella colwelliana TaxID=23 RepID=UPI00299F4AE5|nr:DUF3857 domain-containing protein [Shewanella colwelliana]MDX1280518.1 DUF3857 domain-containing protein [Shewanella colwelliana]